MTMLNRLQFVSFDGRKDGEHNGAGFVEIDQIFAAQDFFSTKL